MVLKSRGEYKNSEDFRDSFLQTLTPGVIKRSNFIQWIAKVSDENLMALVKQIDPTITAGSAAALALYFRSLKRINAHLRNVATGVVNPFHRIGYKPKKKKNV